VPSDFQWPVWRAAKTQRKLFRTVTHEINEPLLFLAQLDLAEVRPEWLDIDVPRHGILSFFFATNGFDPTDRGSWRLFWFDCDPSRLRRIATEAAEISAAPLKPSLRLTINSDALDPAAEEDDRIYDLFEPHDEGVQLGGDPYVIQTPLEEECEYASRGYESYGAVGAAERDVVRRAAKEWRLLVQINSIEGAKLEWGDGGNVYVLARESDLRERKFENAWTVLQCY
jgi:uncharacterized protein YwqG